MHHLHDKIDPCKFFKRGQIKVKRSDVTCPEKVNVDEIGKEGSKEASPVIVDE